MNLLPLLLVPTSMLVIMTLLTLTCWLESRLLSPRSLIVASARSRHAQPEHIERFIAAQSEQLLESPEAPVQAAAATRP